MEPKEPKEPKEDISDPYRNLAKKYYHRFLEKEGMPLYMDNNTCDRLENHLKVSYKFDWDAEIVEKTTNDISALSPKSHLVPAGWKEVEKSCYQFLETTHPKESLNNPQDDLEKLFEVKAFSSSSAKDTVLNYKKTKMQPQQNLLSTLLKKLGF
ncbi:MAG: hypothetical protein P8P30_10835 [Rickettsiales bacterium]|nr:hypothetical protein [Rickettsiales bacterium]